MKRLVIASLAMLLVASASASVDAKDNKAPKVKPKLALMVEGKVTKEILPKSEVEKPGVGTDYTFEWSGGQGDIIINGTGGLAGG